MQIGETIRAIWITYTLSNWLYKVGEGIYHLCGDQWHAWILDIPHKQVDVLASVSSLMKRGWWFSVGSVPLDFVRASPLSPMEKLVHLGQKQHNTFQKLRQNWILQLKGGRNQRYFYRKRKSMGKDTELRKTRRKLSKSQDCYPLFQKRFGGIFTLILSSASPMFRAPCQARFPRRHQAWQPHLLVPMPQASPILNFYWRAAKGYSSPYAPGCPSRPATGCR